MPACFNRDGSAIANRIDPRRSISVGRLPTTVAQSHAHQSAVTSRDGDINRLNEFLRFANLSLRTRRSPMMTSGESGDTLRKIVLLRSMNDLALITGSWSCERMAHRRYRRSRVLQRALCTALGRPEHDQRSESGPCWPYQSGLTGLSHCAVEREQLRHLLD